MIYKFDKKNLNYKRITGGMILIGITILSILMTVTIGLRIHYHTEKIGLSDETRAIILQEENQFSRDKLKAYLGTFNLRYPNIVLAQAEIESGNFISQIFKENNNLFGMRQAKQRCTTNKGDQGGYALYDSWKESVQDYVLLIASQNVANVKTEEKYLEYLGQYYAEDTLYIQKIKQRLLQINLEDKK